MIQTKQLNGLCLRQTKKSSHYHRVDQGFTNTRSMIYKDMLYKDQLLPQYWTLM